ncbi:hemicentin-1-like isoform X2 [Macrosteles quadrilineatus]|uniref:hemicentin-1-like isoform X2 n=1 Tax=Macrosteles quadrilineatus TaxID=74068 RepID=UPI0023E1783B|nr:hemicentin-1-like isoform X2 [Macrosteles quadrilineatus]
MCARVRFMATVHSLVSLGLCLTSKSGGGPKSFPKEEPFNLTSLFTDNEDRSLQDLSGFWSYNDSSDISKYEDFDHSKLLDNPKLKLAIELPEDYERLEFQSSPAPYEVPVFDTSLTTNISVQLGGTATFYCRVRNTREDRVSWVRRRDWHILSSGTMTYTNDERFQVVHVDSTDDWDLQIKYVQRRDNGTYECQVGTKFGILSHYYNLHVIVPTAFILGSGEYHIGEGSTISLVCIIENSPTPPQYVFWYHNDKMVNYDSVRGGVTVDTEPGPKTHSRLIVNKATPADTGNYTCRAPNTDPDTIYVFVSKGENTAAISRPDSASNFRPLRRSSLAFFSIFFILFTNLYN